MNSITQEEFDSYFLQQGLTLIKLAKWLNETAKIKDTGKRFTVSDAQQYAMRGKIPNKYGGNTIIRSSDASFGRSGLFVLKTTDKKERALIQKKLFKLIE
jgi:hypothetical protein